MSLNNCDSLDGLFNWFDFRTEQLIGQVKDQTQLQLKTAKVVHRTQQEI
jgi:hypothetical protein